MYKGKYVAAAKAAPRKKAPKKEKKHITKGTVIFYALYLLLIIAFFIGMNYVMGLLNDWLIRFETSQPETKSQEAFEQLFADPDWNELYDLAGFQDTLFESKDSYSAYMEKKVGDKELTYIKTSAGLTGGHKYIVKLGDENLGTFTLQNHVEGELEIPDWQLDTVEMFIERLEDVTIRTQPGHVVSINGIPMSDSYIVSKTCTVLDDYAPEGFHGDRSVTYYTDGLLVTPEVTITDENGNALECAYDQETGMYYEVLSPKPEISKSEYDAMVNATKSYAKYMIGAAGASLSSYFNTSSDLFRFITGNDLWFRGYTGYNFSKETVSEYHRYSDNMFSARIQITLNVIRSNGSVKEFDIDHTFFFKKNANGVWKAFEMTNVDLQKEITEVRLTFKSGSEVIHQDMYNANSTTLNTPAVTVPEGQQFLGWFREIRDENGDTTLQLMFQPDENGNVTLPHGYVMEHMVLIARFGKEGA